MVTARCGRGWLGIAALAGALAAATAAAKIPAQDELLALSQAAVGNQLGDYRLTDHHGASVMLSELRGKPVILNFVYTSCHSSCPMVIEHLDRVVKGARDTFDENAFYVVTVGFDTRYDTPTRMGQFARQHGVSDPQWYFVTGTEQTVRSLADDTGFTWFEAPHGFDHITQVSVISAEGTVYRQIYGEVIHLPILVEPLKELIWGAQASANTLEGWVDGLRLLCTVFDPASGRYRFDYSVIIGAVIGALSLTGLGIFLVRAWRRV